MPVAASADASWAHAGTAPAPQRSDVYPVGETIRAFDPDVPREWRGARTPAPVTRIRYPADVAVHAVPHAQLINTCLPAATQALANVRNDPPGVDRDAVHRLAIEQAASFFGASLTGSARTTVPQAASN